MAWLGGWKGCRGGGGHRHGRTRSGAPSARGMTPDLEVPSMARVVVLDKPPLRQLAHPEILNWASENDAKAFALSR